MLRHLWVGIFAVILAGGCARKQEEVRLPVPVKVQRVTQASGGGGLRYSATIKPDVQVDLSFKVGGYLAEILQVKDMDGRLRPVQEGDFVRKGAVLAQVRDNEYRDRVAEAQAALTQAKADFDRADRLFENQTISKAEYDAALARFTGTQARYNQAAANLGDCTLRAPMDGYVLRRNVEVGGLVGPGTPGFVLADTRSVKVAFGAPDVVVVGLNMGDRQTITTEAVPGAVFEGAITRIAASADPNSRVFEVECTLPNPENRFKVGMIASLRLSTRDSEKPVTLAPLTAIVRPGDDPKGYAVFVVDERSGKAVVHSRRVKLGEMVGNAIDVVEGVGAGEQIVVAGATMVFDGQEVRIVP